MCNFTQNYLKLAKDGKGNSGGKKWTSNLEGLFKPESMAVLSRHSDKHLVCVQL